MHGPERVRRKVDIAIDQVVELTPDAVILRGDGGAGDLLPAVPA